jgi:hypothetical protein
MPRNGVRRRGRASCDALPDDLYIRFEPSPRIGRPAKHNLETWRVTDDWPARVPVTEAQIDVFEAWFGDLFDELFGPSR